MFITILLVLHFGVLLLLIHHDPSHLYDAKLKARLDNESNL